MKTLKNVWLTDKGPEVYSITLESASLVPHEKLLANAMEFPANNPTRHTTALTLLGIDDLIMIADKIYEEVDRLNNSFQH